jgi:hypothetical protein
MRAAELITIAGTRGIDLKHIAGNASNIHGIARKRERTKQELISGVDVEPTRGRGSRVYRRPEYTVAEVGQAAKDVPRMPWLAARYSWGRDRSNYRELHAGLTQAAFKQKERENWPWRVVKLNGLPGYYIEELGQLVLGYEAFMAEFTAYPVLYSASLGVSDEIWSATLAPCFLSLHQTYKDWLDMVQRSMGRWLREEEPDSRMSHDASHQ